MKLFAESVNEKINAVNLIVLNVSVSTEAISLLKTNTESVERFFSSLVSAASDTNSVRNTLNPVSQLKFDLQTKDNTNIVLPKITL